MKSAGTQQHLKLATIGLLLAGSLSGGVSANDGWYLGLEGGVNDVGGQKFRIFSADRPLFPVADGTQVSDVSFDEGYVAGLVAGYAAGFGLQVELELAHRDNDFDEVLLEDGQPSQRVGGREFADTAFGNLWYDFFPSSRLRPYVGGGAGIARVAVRDPSVDSVGFFQDGSNLRSDFDAVFAWQAGAGLRYDLTRRWTASLDYRYLRANTGRFDLLDNNPNSFVKARYWSQSALLSIRYHFGAAPSPAPQAPEEPVAVVPVVAAPIEEPAAEAIPEPRCVAPENGNAAELGGCKPGDVIVLRGVNFAFDQATLEPNARALLDGVVVALNKYPDIKVSVQGHTDSRGADAYNLKLSDRRAKAVGDYLVKAGVDASRITSAGFGETQPVADNATDEGRELNRRVALKVVERSGTASAE